MQVITSDYGFNQFSGFNPVVGTMREITDSEIEQVSGGIAPLIIAGARIAAASFIGAFAASAAQDAYRFLVRDSSSR